MLKFTFSCQWLKGLAVLVVSRLVSPHQCNRVAQRENQPCSSKASHSVFKIV